MNPLTNVKNITKLNEIELASGLIHKKSWHHIYKESAWIFIGGLEYGLTEGDVITVFSQFGEVVNLNLVRDKKTGKSKGFCFLCYANQKSTVLAVDNLNGIKLCNRTIRVDHVANYKPPKEDERDDEITKMLKSEGCAPKHFKSNENNMTSNTNDQPKKKKQKKEKKEKKKKKRKCSSNEGDSGNQSNAAEIKVKEEKLDHGYDKYDTSLNRTWDNAEKRRYQERNYEQSQNESSRSGEKCRTKADEHHHMLSERNDIPREDKLIDKHRMKGRSVSQHHKEVHKVSDRDFATIPRKIKRERSNSSSDDSSSHYKDCVKYNSEKAKSKGKPLNSRRKHTEANQCSSSSSDEDSSSESSSDDDRRKTESRNFTRDKYKSYDDKRSFNEEKVTKHDHRSENSSYTSSKSKHYDKTDKNPEYRSKNKYRSENKYDNHHEDYYHRSKYDKR